MSPNQAIAPDYVSKKQIEDDSHSKVDNILASRHCYLGFNSWHVQKFFKLNIYDAEVY